MEDIKKTFAKNLSENRKKLGLTQAELAVRLNFSDKSISKWERGDGLPDVETMTQMAVLFQTTVDNLISEKLKEPTLSMREKIMNKSKMFITILSVGLVWLVFATLFVILKLAVPTLPDTWLCFVYAVPVSAIVLIVFSAMWGKHWQTATAVSILIWTLILSIFLTVDFDGIWMLFIACIPLQILTIIWYIFKSFGKRYK